MKFTDIILYISIIIWSTIPFRQKGKKYFYFFYVLALIDPLTMYLRNLFHSSSNFFYIPLSFLSLTSLFENEFIRKNKLHIIAVVILFCGLELKSDLYTTFFIVAVISFLILIKFINNLIVLLNKERVFNIFLIVLILNSITEIFKFLGIFYGVINDYFYFYVFLIFQIFIGIFFWIFKEDNPKLNLRFNIEWNDL